MFEFLIEKERVADFCTFKIIDTEMSDFFTMQSCSTFTMKMQIDWAFKEEIQSWIDEHNIKCELLNYEEIAHTFPKSICFEQESDAVLFKLTWM
jgi:hypothetical protein